MTPIQIKLPTIFENMSVNAWLIKGEYPTLIDCGEKTEKSWHALLSGLKANGLSIEDIQKVVITHAHLDHIGMANKITQHSDATIYLNEYCYDWGISLKKMLDRRTEAILEVTRQNYPEKIIQKYFHFGYKMLKPYWDEIPKDRIKIFPMEGKIDLSGTDWEIIYAPGHCINQTCFFNPKNGHFLSADMLLRMIPTPIIDASIIPPYTPVKSLVMHLESYEKVRQLPITKAFPGHFEAFENVPQLIDKQLNKIKSRTEKCLEGIRNGKTTALELANYVYPNRINNATLFMVLGFLDILLVEGRIEGKYTVEGVRYIGKDGY